MIDYKLIRSNRKTVTIKITYDGTEVRAPHNTPLSVIDDFVQSKEDWIAEKSVIMQERSANRKDFYVDYGHMIRYRGKKYPIKASDLHYGFDGSAFHIPPGLDPAAIKNYCILFYNMYGSSVIEKKLNEFSALMNTSYNGFRLTNAQKQWGSCNSKKVISFSRRLIMADDDLIDYVIIHELAHTIELNHSTRFWEIVENYMPDFRDRKARIDDLQKELMHEDWS